MVLYTSKPTEEEITNAKLSQDKADLFTFTLSNMYFSFKGHISRQSEGLPIDSSISGILAILSWTN